MLDGVLRRIVDPPLDAAARRLAAAGWGADAVTAGALVLGVCCAVAVAFDAMIPALLALALGRIGDGLDGALARQGRPTDRGGYADIVADFVFYGAVPLAFAWRDPAHALPAAFLLFTFYVNGASFLAYAAVAAARGLQTTSRGLKSIYFTAGLAEGAETILAFVIAILRPSWFPAVAVVFGLMCLVTAASRAALAWKTFR